METQVARNSKRWSSRFGFYLVAIGSACGLGNIWRFPYIVGENGGGAFVLLYLFLTLSVGLPLLVGELLLGKITRRSILLAAKGEGKLYPSLKWVGRFSVLVTIFVLSYYAVISGWVLHFVTQYFFGSFDVPNFKPEFILGSLLKNGTLQVALSSVHILLSVIIVMKGIHEGLEKWIGNMMPIFFFLLLVLMAKSLSLSGSDQGIRFLFYPDFSKLSTSSLIAALGHVFFTLSLGFGTMVTFGSYLNQDDHVPSAGTRVAVADVGISLLAGLLVFPVILAGGSPNVSDPTLIFEALPQFLSEIRGGFMYGLAFFVCLYIAALGASIGLLEVAVSNIVERFPRFSRNQASLLAGFIAFLIAIFPSLSSSVFSEILIYQKPVLEALDSLFVGILLPLLGLGMSLALRFRISREEVEAEFQAQGHMNSAALMKPWMWAVKWWIPLVTFIAFSTWIWGLLKVGA